jgi:N-methylhydantoinase A
MIPSDGQHIRFAVDVGGTFTDLIAWDSITGHIRTNKSSTTADPSQGVLDVLAKDGLPLHAAQLFVHGTTLGINAVLQKKGARTGLITTRGFRDVLEIGRIDRPFMYDILYEKPPALVPRPLRLEVDERMDARGNVLRPLNEGDVRRAIEILRQQNVQAIAVSLLHSYANPAHEQRVGEILAREMPGAYFTLSHRILREYYEYERTMSAVMNCYTQPLMESYVDGLHARLRAQGFSGTFLLLRSSGGAMSYSEAREAPVFTLLSGPAGGVLGASHLAELTGCENLITADGGGTSFDVSLVVNRQPRIVTETTVEGYKLLLPVLDIRSIGAGGGSIAWIDDGGALQVGPQSAGANPGPICYRRGGTRPTVTDAALCLGIFNADYFLGGEMHLDAGAAREALEEIARLLGMDLATAASGILTIAETKMAGAIREMTIEKGFDPRDFALLAFGGSGPLFACNLGRRCGVTRVLVPVAPANFSAWGMLMSDLVHDYSRTLVLDLDRISSEQVESAFAELEAMAERALEIDGVEPARRQFFRSLDMRYFGQGGHSVTVPLEGGAFTAEIRQNLERSFHHLHETTYGHRTDDPVQIVHLRVRGLGVVPKPRIQKIAAGGQDASRAIKQTRQVYWREVGGARPWPIYERSRLGAGHAFTGPAIVEEPTTTTVVGPGDRATVDLYGNLVIEIERL